MLAVKFFAPFKESEQLCLQPMQSGAKSKPVAPIELSLAGFVSHVRTKKSLTSSASRRHWPLEVGTLHTMNSEAKNAASREAADTSNPNSTNASVGETIGEVAEPPAHPSVLPILEEIEAMTLPMPPITESIIEPEAVIEEAEQLLREGAPHDFDVLILGAGPGGMAAAIECARGGLHTALVEEREIGGVHLNRGAIGTQSLLKSVAVLRQMRSARDFGVDVSGSIAPSFAAMQARKNLLISQLREQSQRELEEAGVEFLRGRARFVEAHTTEIYNRETNQIRRVTAIQVVIAVGGVPVRPDIEGANLPGVVTSDAVLKQNFIPERLAIVGAGPMGAEFATIFASLGSHVTVVEPSSTVLPSEDEDVGLALRLSLENMGVRVVSGAVMEKITQNESGSGLTLNFRRCDATECVSADEILLAIGRTSQIHDLGLNEVGIATSHGKIEVDEAHETSVRGVYAIGDCIRRTGWAHQAAFEGREVAASLLGLKPTKSARFVPNCIFTSPEIATVGLTLVEAVELGIDAQASKVSFANETAMEGAPGHFLKLVVERGTSRLLGCQIVKDNASILINEIALALHLGASASTVADTLHGTLEWCETLRRAVQAILEGESEK